MLPHITPSYQLTQTLNAISTLFTDICDESTEPTDTNPSTYHLLYHIYIHIESKIQPFLSKNIPSISISNYLTRLSKYTSIEYSTLETMLILIDRFCNKTQIILNYFNIHK
jgi:hypothetical protein